MAFTNYGTSFANSVGKVMKHTLPILLLLLGACGDTTSLPQPVPVPAPKLSAIRQSTPGLQQRTTMVVGLPGAVAGAGRVLARETLSGAEATATSTATGTFSLTTALGESIELRYETPEGDLSEAVVLAPTRSTYGPSLDESDGTDSVVSPPDAEGVVTVSNGSPDPLIIASPQVTVIVSNRDTGEVVTGETDSAGLFSLQLHGEAGHGILIVLSDPAQPEQTSDFLAYEVP